MKGKQRRVKDMSKKNNEVDSKGMTPCTIYLRRDIKKMVEGIAKDQHRGFSSQIAYWIDRELKSLGLLDSGILEVTPGEPSKGNISPKGSGHQVPDRGGRNSKNQKGGGDGGDN